MIILSEALRLYLLVDRAEQTQRTYERFLTRFIDSIGPNRPLNLIRPEDIDAYIRSMRRRNVKYSDHPQRPTEREPLASTTVYKNVKMIKMFFSWCVRRKYLFESPAAHIQNRRPKRPLGQGKAATDDEFQAILDAARYKLRDRALVLLVGESGCRAGEAAGLRIADLELGQRSAIVTGKGDKRRRIYYDEDAADALHAWLEERPSVNHDYVFTSHRGHGKLRTRSVSEIIRRLAQTAGLKRPLGAHSLRHRVGLTFARQRVAPRVTQHYLGHTDIKTTLEYYQDVDETDLRLAGRLVSPMRSDDWREEVQKHPATKLLKPPRTG